MEGVGGWGKGGVHIENVNKLRKAIKMFINR